MLLKNDLSDNHVKVKVGCVFPMFIALYYSMRNSHEMTNGKAHYTEVCLITRDLYDHLKKGVKAIKKVKMAGLKMTPRALVSFTSPDWSVDFIIRERVQSGDGLGAGSQRGGRWANFAFIFLKAF